MMVTTHLHLQVHKKFVLRSRIESREEAARVASLEAELERVATLSRNTEQYLEEKRSGEMLTRGEIKP